MSNPVLQSAQSSAVVATLRESDTVNPFVYNEKGRIVSPHSMSLLKITKSSGSVGASKTCSFDIAKNGLLTGLYLQMSMPANTDINDGDTVNNNIQEQADGATVQLGTNAQGFTVMGILHTIDNIVLQTSGRQLERLSRFQMLARYSSLPASKKVAVQESLRFALQPEKTAYKVIMWLPFYFFREMEKYHYNTSFNEPLRLDITLSDCKYLQTAPLQNGSLTEHAPTDIECVAQYRQLDARDEDALVNAQYGDGLLSQCVSMMKEEAVHTFTSAASGDTSVPIDLKENLCVSKIYIMVSQPNAIANNDAYAVTLRQRDVANEISNIKLSASGVNIVDCHGDLLKYFGKWGEHDSANVSHGNGERAFENIYCIDFTTTHKGHTNTVAFRELSTPRLELDVSCRAANKQYELRVMYGTTTFLSTSSATGRVQLSISS